MERSAGILMPIASLPSKYGIGTLGKSAYKFVDFLESAGQRFWQVLPIGQTGYGDSPYQSFSSFAGNPYFVDLEELMEEGLLKEEDLKGINWGKEKDHIDYGKIYENRIRALKLACKKGLAKNEGAFYRFLEQNQRWLTEYALFMSLKEHFGMVSWTQWPDEAIKRHEPGSCNYYKDMLREDIQAYQYMQFLFFKQWDKLREYAHKKNIQIIGDLPIYVAMDSCDVWSERQWFQITENNEPAVVAGCPPDAFTKDGQLWGNPIYDWWRLKEDGYGFWIRRLDGTLRFYDVLRLDHFRGFESYWEIPFGEKTARNGRWVQGPGMDFLRPVLGWFSGKQFIAEDLGYVTPQVEQLLKDSGLPGMKVLQFAFDSREGADYLPYTYQSHSLCYVGTHDNATAMEWLEEGNSKDVKEAMAYLDFDPKGEEGFAWAMLRMGMSSVCDLFIAPMQDYLELGKEARMNVPGTIEGNWTWRMKASDMTVSLAKKIKNLTMCYGRIWE